MNTDKDIPENMSLIVTDKKDIPEDLPILPIENQVAFPGLNMTLSISKRSLTLVEEVMKDNRIVGLIGVKTQANKRPPPERIQGTGTAVRILYATRTDENGCTQLFFKITTILKPSFKGIAALACKFKNNH